ncbi:MAG: recombination protein RecR [Candidatus Moranbacteria bacterium GW2011_GWF2_34_56]|nr:MAG: recombination protein RecR [Candidatus Moranbacteria bacterium GW2011_GWF2_34_56]
MYPKIFQKLIENFSALPSVGPKMAERLVLFLFKQDKEKLLEFAKNLTVKNATIFLKGICAEFVRTEIALMQLFA